MLDRLTLDQLRTLVAVADEGSFSAAARRLGRVQSAVSQTVQMLESTLGTPLFDRNGKIPRLNDAGRVILDGARHILRDTEMLRARAESMTSEVEPELTLAVDAMFPGEVLRESLAELSRIFPCLPVTLFTEGLGGSEQRLRDGAARLALYAPMLGPAPDLETEFLVAVPTVPVVAPTHPLASEPPPVGRPALEKHVQLVLTDRSPLTAGMSGGIVSRRIWRFADQSTRIEYLLAGFGWCNMPTHLVAGQVNAGRLKVLDLREGRLPPIPIHVAHQLGREPGKAGRWLIEDLRVRVARCVGAHPPVEFV